MRRRLKEVKCGPGFLTPTCCCPRCAPAPGPPHFVVFTAGTCIPGIAVSKVSREARYLFVSWIMIFLCLFVSLSPFFAQNFTALLLGDNEKEWEKRDNRKKGRRSSRGGGGMKAAWDQSRGKGLTAVWWGFVWDALDFCDQCVVSTSPLSTA